MKNDKNKTAWSLDSAGVGTGFMPEDKIFLDSVFQRYPQIGQAFQECARMLPTNREHEVRQKMTQVERRVWEDCGIPEGRRETLAEHTGRMMMLANMYPQKNYDYAETNKKISVWALPRVIGDEIPFDEMPPKERFRLYDNAAKMVCSDHTQRATLATWRDLETPATQRKPFGHSPDESDWVNTLDYLATAQKAREYQRQFPNRAETLERLIESCGCGITTKEGHAIWDKVVGPAPDLRPISVTLSTLNVSEREAPSQPASSGRVYKPASEPAGNIPV